MSMEMVIWLTGLCILASMAVAYQRSHDPLHPLMFLGPMLFYVYAFVPGTLYYRDLLSDRFSEESDVIYAQTVMLLGIVFFCAGSLRPRVPPAYLQFRRFEITFTPPVRKRMEVLSYVLGFFGLGSFLYMLWHSGGLVDVYSTPKGGSTASSGYLTTAPLLTILAIMLYLLSQQGKKLRPKTVLILLLFISPHLVHGLLAASRGTTFLALGTLVFSWYLTTPKRPSPRVIISTVACIGLLMIFLKSQRREIYIGSDLQFDQQAFSESLVPASADAGDTSTYSWGLILTSRAVNMHYWGKRYAVQLLVRPIPKQIWPTKYEDVGLDSMVTMPGSGGMTYSDWLGAVGWIPNAGSATGFIADSYLEFAWGCLIVSYLIGYFYSYLWKKSAIQRGVWSIVYFEACVVSVFLPTQGLSSAWAYRFIYLAVPTIVIWRFVIEPIINKVHRHAPVSMPPPRPPQPVGALGGAR